MICEDVMKAMLILSKHHQSHIHKDTYKHTSTQTYKHTNTHIQAHKHIYAKHTRIHTQ